MPATVRAEMARWLAPEAPKPNGPDPHPPRVATPSPPKTKAKVRGANPTNARTAERQLLAAMRDNPCLSVITLANAAAASRSTTGERLRRLAAAGVVEKDHAGRWRLKAEETEARPTIAPST
jgi:hypothetical protein